MHFNLAICLLAYSFTRVVANTEIVNFSATKEEHVNIPFTDVWPVLSSQSPTISLNVTSAPLGSLLPYSVCAQLDKWHPDQHHHVCPYEVWIILDLDDDEWRGFEKFTLRLSWPAFHPTDVAMKIVEPTALRSFSTGRHRTQETRRKYARIQLVHTGVLTPTSERRNDVSRFEVSVFLVLEPLQFGFLPISVRPVIGAIVLAVIAGLFVARQINHRLQPIAKKIRDERKTRSKFT